ncbi:MAG: hypothetical protein RL026_2335 [Pseudomonadota bacterium]
MIGLRPRRLPWWTLLATVAGMLLATTLLWWWKSPEPAAGAVTVKLRLAGEPEALELGRDAQGHYVYWLQSDGGRRQLTPDELAARLYDANRPRDWFATVLNVTSPVGLLWIAIGLSGQLLFTGRMLVQWLASERAGRSHVPEAFWWMSLGGSSLLLAYFVWRVDVVGILGQLAGWGVYVRNLMLLARTRQHDLKAS